MSAFPPSTAVNACGVAFVGNVLDLLGGIPYFAAGSRNARCHTAPGRSRRPRKFRRIGFHVGKEVLRSLYLEAVGTEIVEKSTKNCASGVVLCRCRDSSLPASDY